MNFTCERSKCSKVVLALKIERSRERERERETERERRETKTRAAQITRNNRNGTRHR